MAGELCTPWPSAQYVNFGGWRRANFQEQSAASGARTLMDPTGSSERDSPTTRYGKGRALIGCGADEMVRR